MHLFRGTLKFQRPEALTLERLDVVEGGSYQLSHIVGVLLNLAGLGFWDMAPQAPFLVAPGSHLCSQH